MHALRNWVLGVAGGLVAVAARPAPASYPGQAAANEVTESSYRYYLGDNLGVAGILYTHDGDNRGSGPEHDRARANIAWAFEGLGLSVALEPFTYFGTTYYNVVATQLGTTYPNQIYIVGAHFDSVNNPGADDNASGVALVLEAARILSQYPSDSTIRYIAFDREEDGLVGSDAYVSDHIADNILGMISTDMVAYDPSTNHALIYGVTASNPIKTAVGDAVAMYSGGLTYTIGGDVPASDHAPFEDAGFLACLLIEGEVWNNPNYHTQQDSVDTPNYINYPYAVKMVRSVVGFLVDHAGVNVPVNILGFTYPGGRPQFSDPPGGTSMRVDVFGIGSAVPQPGTGLFHYDTGAGWQTVPMTAVSTNGYEAVFPAAACGQEILYYVSATAVGGEAFTDPWNAPGTVYSATAAYGEAVGFEDNFDLNPGWTTAGQWAFGQPTGGGGQYGGPDPTGGHTGNNVYGYNLSGDYPNNLPETHLTSTAIDCTGLFNVHLKFWRWLGVEQPAYDHAYVRVSNNGTTWTTVWENTTEITDTTWTEMDLDISAVADDQPTVYLRWTMGPTDAGWTYCGWNIDDVRVVASECNPPVDGDHDDDGDVDLFDFAWFQSCFRGDGLPYPAGIGCENFDFNTDGDVDPDDYTTFHALFSGALP